MPTLAFWLIVSIVLTIVLNVALRLFPDASGRLRDGIARLAEHPADEPRSPADGPNVRIYFPWKAMLIGSVVLTVAINLVFFARR